MNKAAAIRAMATRYPVLMPRLGDGRKFRHGQNRSSFDEMPNSCCGAKLTVDFPAPPETLSAYSAAKKAPLADGGSHDNHRSSR